MGPCLAGVPRSMDASRGHHPVGHLVAGRHWQRHAARQRCTMRAVWTSTWSVHCLHFGPRHARRCPIARVNICAQLGHRVAAGEPPRAVPWHALWARPARRRGPRPAANQACCGPHCPVRFGVVHAGRAQFWPSSRLKLKKYFLFLFGFKLNSNFRNLYLNIQSPKNYEISSVGFIIF
jgi:hypothetical protein